MDAYEEFKNEFKLKTNLGELGEWLGSFSENLDKEVNKKKLKKEIYKYAKELNGEYKLDKINRYKFQKEYSENYNIFQKNQIAQEIIEGKQQKNWQGTFLFSESYYGKHEKLLDLVELVYKDYLKVNWGKPYDYSQYINSMNCLISDEEMEAINEEDRRNNGGFDLNCITILFLAKFMENNMQRLRYSVDSFINKEYFYIETKKISSGVKEMELRLLKLKEETENANQEFRKSKEELEGIEKNLENANDKIKNINNNMVTIMALFLTAFSIIGVNVYSLNKEFGANQIVLINSSLVFVLSFLMYLLDKIINDSKAKLGKTIFLTAGILIAVLIWNK